MLNVPASLYIRRNSRREHASDYKTGNGHHPYHRNTGDDELHNQKPTFRLNLCILYIWDLFALDIQGCKCTRPLYLQLDTLFQLHNESLCMDLLYS